MTHKLEINRMPATADAAIVFVASLDQQIEELDAALALTKQVRGTVARAFGIDRREGASPMGRLLDAASRSTLEIDQAQLEKDLEFPPLRGFSPEISTAEVVVKDGVVVKSGALK